jgi:hypothetical protein
LESLVLGAVLLAAASRRRSGFAWVLGAVFAMAMTAAIGCQYYFFEQYNAYLNTDVSEFASNFKDSIVSQLLADLGNYMKVLLPIFFVSVGLLVLARHSVRLKRRPGFHRAIGANAADGAPVVARATLYPSPVAPAQCPARSARERAGRCCLH